MEIHWWCLRFREDTEVVVKVKSDGDQSDHSSSSNSEESSSLSLHSTAIRRDKMAATSLPKWSLFSCSRCASTLRRLKPKRTVTVSICAWQHVHYTLQSRVCSCSWRNTVIYQYRKMIYIMQAVQLKLLESLITSIHFVVIRKGTRLVIFHRKSKAVIL